MHLAQRLRPKSATVPHRSNVADAPARASPLSAASTAPECTLESALKSGRLLQGKAGPAGWILPYDRLHHFIGAGLWDSAPLEATLWKQADALVGGDEAWLIVDDTALPKKGKASVGVAPQYATVLGKNANCQTLV